MRREGRRVGRREGGGIQGYKTRTEEAVMEEKEGGEKGREGGRE